MYIFILIINYFVLFIDLKNIFKLFYFIFNATNVLRSAIYINQKSYNIENLKSYGIFKVLYFWYCRG